MQILSPITIDDSVLTTSSLPETAPAVWSSGTTYSAIDTASVATTANGYDVYQSLQNTNLNHAPASSSTWWKKIGSTYGIWGSGTTYALGDYVLVLGTNIHRLYKSLQASNLNKDPSDAANEAWWVLVGADNRWAMFDTSVSTQSVQPDQLVVGLHSTARIDAVAGVNLSASSVQTVVRDAFGVTIYDNTLSLVSTDGITDWYHYFTDDVARATGFKMTDIPPTSNCNITVTYTDTGNTVAVGATLIGSVIDAGDTQFTSSIGIQDYSIKQADEFGDYQIVQRSFSKTADLTVWIKKSQVDTLANLLATLRATPTLYIGSDGYESTTVYGFYKDFTIEIEYDPVSVLTIQLEGLT